MTQSLILLQNVFSGAALFCVIMLLGKMRLSGMVRYYALSSLAIAGLYWSLSGGDEPFLWLVALMAIVTKVLFIPWLITYAAKRSGALQRLQSYVRPARSYFLAVCVLIVALFVMAHSPFAVEGPVRDMLYVAIALVLLGITMMMIRRDLFSQMIGFLVMENGIAIFGLATVGSIPMLVELGVFLVITMGGLIMAILTTDVQEEYGSGDTESLRELID